MEETPEADVARNQRRERLFSAIAAVSTVSTLPDGRVDQLPVIAELLRAADDVALHSEMEGLVDEIASRTADYPDAALTIVFAARMRVNDRLIVGHGSKDLEVLRVDYCGQSAAVPELDIEIRPTVDGSIALETSRPGEELLIALAGVVQIIVQGEDEALDYLKRQLVELGRKRGRETFGLQGEFALLFGLGLGMRAAWGCATVAITNQRILGVIFDDNLAGRGRSPADEAAWMPMASAAPDLSSMIVFSLPRTSVSEVEVLDNGLLASRVPYANVDGEDYTLVLDTARVFEADRLVRPKKNQLGDAIRALPSSPIPSSGKPVARGADEHAAALSKSPRPRGAPPRPAGTTKMFAISGLVLIAAALAFVLGSLVMRGGSDTDAKGPVTIALTATNAQGTTPSDDETTDTQPDPRTGGASAGRTAAELVEGIPQDGIVLGDPKAPLTIEEFVDFQCPFCAQFSREVFPTVLADYVKTGKARVVLRTLTFLGEDSVTAARFATAAGFQNKQWQFTEAFYAQQGEENTGYVTDEFLRKVAADAGVDYAKAAEEQGSEKVTVIVNKAALLAGEQGVNSTPSFAMGPTGGTLKLVRVDPFDEAAFTDALDKQFAGAEQGP